MGLPYYKCYPDHFFEGTQNMPGEEKCAYAVVLHLIYKCDGRLKADASVYIAGHLGYSVRKWNSLFKRLLASGKLVVIDGFILNSRARAELEQTFKYQRTQSENATKDKENNEEKKPSLSHQDQDQDKDILGDGGEGAQSEKLEDDLVDDGPPNNIVHLHERVETFAKHTTPVERIRAAISHPLLEKLTHPEVVDRWIAKGWDLETEIIPAVSAAIEKVTGVVRVWGYFTAPVHRYVVSQRRQLAGVQALGIEPPGAQRAAGKAKRSAAEIAARADANVAAAKGA